MNLLLCAPSAAVRDLQSARPCRAAVSSGAAADELVIAVSRHDAPDLWQPADDPESGVQVALFGRIALEPAAWREADRLPFAGGRACAAILQHWLQRPATLGDWLNGACAVVILDRRERRLHLFTDRMGLCPVYAPRAGRFLLGTHPDVLADAMQVEGRTLSLDLGTVAEVIGTGSSVQPHTYYQEIRQLDAGCHYRWRLDAPERPPAVEAYWHPHYLDEPPPDRVQNELVDEFADAWVRAVRRRTTGRLGPCAVFLSGGADSRGMLFALEDPSQAQCITFYDEPNAEVATAAALARAAGATHHLWPRDPEHYALGAEETVRITGGMWSIMSGHYTPFLDRVAALGCGTWLTACYADYLFKGLAFNRAHRQLLGRNLPLKRLDEFAFEFYMPHHRLAAGYQKLVRQRLEQHLAGIETTDYARSALPVEERRLRPASREADAAGRLSLQRAGSCDWVFSDNDVLDVYGRLSVASKLNGIVFERTVARVCGPASASIRNNNYGTRLGASDWQRSLQFVAASLGRKVRRRLGRPDLGLEDGLASAGSWPNWHYLVAHSQGFAELWSQPSAAERAFFGQFLGHDPWQKPMQQWGAEPFLFCQLLTVRLWLRQRRLL